jgi:hypothetical protein
MLFNFYGRRTANEPVFDLHQILMDKRATQGPLDNPKSRFHRENNESDTSLQLHESFNN